MSALDAPRQFDPMELLTFEMRGSIQIGRNGLIYDYKNGFYAVSTSFQCYDEMGRFRGREAQMEVALRIAQAARNFRTYREYLVPCVKLRFPELALDEKQAMLECLFTLTPENGGNSLGSQLDALSQQIQAEFRTHADDIESLREITCRYSPVFFGYFPGNH